MIIAIDGPAASGKGTLARKLAEVLGYAYLDTGKLYRAVGVRVLEAGKNPQNARAAIRAAELLRDEFDVKWLADPVLLTDKAGQAASKVAVVPDVRMALFDLQRSFALNPPDGKKGAVLDGRDIGTVVCPDAPVKLYITASTEVRAQRRTKELQSKGIDVTYEAVLAEMRQRDARDQGRDTAPLRAADDAFVLDTSDLDMDQVLEKALEFVRTR